MIQKRPSFNMMWAASRQIYDPANSSERVAKIIGGNVAININSTTHPWGNTCAVRLSYMLNKSGMLIPRSNYTVSGADHRWYFYRVKKLIEFLNHQWGKPDLFVPFPPPNTAELKNKMGIILFEISGWIDAGGHATLWNGKYCYDHCYLYQPSAQYRTVRANFWTLS